MVTDKRKRSYSPTVSQMFACLALGIFLCALYLYWCYPQPRKHLRERGEAQSGFAEDMNAKGQRQTYRINVNSAGVAELSLLPGVGPALAKEIILYRQTHGRFTNTRELDKVPGIGPAKLAAIEPWVMCVTQPDGIEAKQ